MLEKKPLPFLGFLQATGLFGYILFVAWFMSTFAERTFDNPEGSEFLTPVMMLMLFVLSATICGLVVLARPGYLFWEKRYTESFTLLAWTIGWGLLYFLSIFFILLN